MAGERRREAFDAVVSASAFHWLDPLILSLDDQARAGFLNDIAALIDGKYGGSVARNFVYEGITART
jgi:hypothetical protein